MPPFDEAKDNMDAFIHRFEIYATTQKWPESKWAVYLGALLRGKALEVYSRLSIDDASDYGILKNALLRRFNFTEEGFKRKFHTAKPEVNEAPAQFIARLSNYFSRWLDFSGIEKTFEALRDLMVREQYLDACTVDLAVFLRERALTDLADLAEVAQKYLDAHVSKGHHHKTGKADEKPNTDNISNQAKIDKTIRAVKTCFTCNKPGHLAKDCFRNKKAAAMTHVRGEQRCWQSKEQVTSPINKQAIGGQVTHTNNNDMHRNEVKKSSDKLLCKAHKRENCADCLDIPKHHCHGMHGAEVELNCGCVIPNVTDACKQRESSHIDDMMPVVNGYLGEKLVSVLRDTGCSTIVVRRSLVDEDQLTGSNETCVLIDGTIRRVPVAEVTLNTPFFKGTIKAVCMRNPLYDVIIGNVPGAGDVFSSSVELVENNHEANAVVTRQQEQRAKKQDKPLKVTDAVDGNVTKDILVQMQRDDLTLKSCWDNIKGSKEDDTGVAYVARKDLLYRVSYDKDGKEIHQLVVPEELRTKVLKLAHESIMSGHLGIRKTKDRIWKIFW